jgi:hypothetical protein
VDSDLIILPKSIFENFPGISNSIGEKKVIESISFRGVEGINNLISNLKSSLYLWEESD